jgi:hypothetical protein
MQSNRRWLYILIILAWLVSSCQSSETETGVDHPVVSRGIPVVSALIPPILQAEDEAAETEINECLNCHSDKERLIETAEPEKPAESESKGVG